MARKLMDKRSNEKVTKFSIKWKISKNAQIRKFSLCIISPT